MDGRLNEQADLQFVTPPTYECLLDAATDHARRLIARPGVSTLGLGITLPGLIDYRTQTGLLSPNLPITNHHSPVQDMAERLGIECVMLQESHALCLAERHYGNARGLTDFAMLDVGTGVGLGVMSGGRLLTGHRGLAGEVGHITVLAEGRACGCGNRGCLETVASDSALAWEVSQRLGRKVSIDEAITLLCDGHFSPVETMEKVCGYLSIGVASVINLFNPSTLFIHGKMFTVDPNLFPRLIAETERRALAPSFADCRIIQARGSKRQGAVAGIIQHLMNALLPPSLQDADYLAVKQSNGD